jgi:aconitate hydratase A / 2-methylisocitrate dehydratase
MSPNHPFAHARVAFTGGSGPGHIFSLPALEKAGLGRISRLPVSIRIVLESLVRNCDGRRVRDSDVRALAAWGPRDERTQEVPFVVARVLLQDFTGVPLLVDLAAMRSATERVGKEPNAIEPLVPVDLVIDHSVQVDFWGRPDALSRNIEMEFDRNRPRYEFLKWGMGAFDGFRIVPPGVGICHQVNLEFLARGVIERDGALFPDTLVGTDSHTTMINGLGIVAWGVGGIEAEAGMLGQPVYFLMPDVVGVHMSGALSAGVTATDLVLHITEMLRKAKVVGKFVEFHGEGAATLACTERATIANMAPEYGATMGFFPVDEMTCRYFKNTGRSDAQVDLIRRYYQEQGMFGMPRSGACDYSQLLELDLAGVRPGVAGPKRPQDRVDLGKLGQTFRDLLVAPAPNGYGKPREEARKRWKVQVDRELPLPHVAGGGAQKSGPTPLTARNELEMVANRPTPDRLPADAPPAPGAAGIETELAHGDVVIAAITSCTNTSNPSVMLAAGLLAKKAVEAGLKVPPLVKTSLAPGSRVVTSYLSKTGLMPYLEQLGFNLVGYGCTTCIGNSGPLEPHLEDAIVRNDVVTAAVLSGNRNFEARVHQSVKANFLMSPPLVVAFALAGRVDIDLTSQPVGKGAGGKEVYLRDIWPTPAELAAVIDAAFDAETYRRLYSSFASEDGLWESIRAPSGVSYAWDATSTYIAEPPYFVGSGGPDAKPQKARDIRGARPLAIFGDSITTDHISPAGAIKPSSPAGKYLQQRGVSVADFNSYGSRRGNHEVMVRGTFANVRIKNLMVPGVEGGVTVHQPEGAQMSIFDAAMAYQKEGTPLVVIAGHEYGTGSSRDWAAKGPRLLGINVAVARSFERIHRSNLVGMGVLPCQFPEGVSAETLGLRGTETFDVVGIETGLRPRMAATLVVHRQDGNVDRVPLTVRIDTPIEVEYYEHGGILPYVLRQLVASDASAV